LPHGQASEQESNIVLDNESSLKVRNEYQTIKRKIKAGSDASVTYAQNSMKKGTFIAGAQALTVGTHEAWSLDDLLRIDLEVLQNVETPNYELILAACAMIISESPTARAMIEEAADDGWSLGCDALQNNDFILDLESKTIMIDHNGMRPNALAYSEYFQNAMMVSLTRGLRDVYQEKRHAAFDEDYGPQDVLLLERTRAADRDVVAILCAWELRSECHSEIWRHIIGSPEGDVAMAFSNYLDRDPSSLFSGKAMAAAFRQWFADLARSNAVDHETLEYLDGVLDYAEAANPFGNKHLSAGKIEQLSCMPDKKAYLQSIGTEILSSPQYAGLFDPINQSHLFHIVHDMNVVVVSDVPFQDAGLANKIFPDFYASETCH